MAGDIPKIRVDVRRRDELDQSGTEEIIARVTRVRRSYGAGMVCCCDEEKYRWTLGLRHAQAQGQMIGGCSHIREW